jgi:hypothetical protein
MIERAFARGHAINRVARRRPALHAPARCETKMNSAVRTHDDAAATGEEHMSTEAQAALVPAIFKLI